MTTSQWRERAPWLTDAMLPRRPDFGERFPWRAVALHAMGREFAARRRQAERLVEALPARRWGLSYSGGKDSMALMALLAGLGLHLPAVSIRSSADYPCARPHVIGSAAQVGQPLAVIDVPTSLPQLLAGAHIFDPLYADRSSAINPFDEAFFEPLRRWREDQGIDGVLLGLRQAESRGRKMNRVSRGHTYERADGVMISSPLVDWSALDVHAMIWTSGLACSPVYLCVDEGADWTRLREDSWFATGAPARIGGHYLWLRRWWPDLWEQAVAVSPDVGRWS